MEIYKLYTKIQIKIFGNKYRLNIIVTSAKIKKKHYENEIQKNVDTSKLFTFIF